MDDALTIQLFFFAMAVPVALEAYKARDRARIVLWAVAVAFGILGFVWPALSSGIPAVRQVGGDLATNPSTWFAIAVALFFVLRPYWAKAPIPPTLADSGEDRITAEIKRRILPLASAQTVQDLSKKVEAIQGHIDAIDRRLQLLDALIKKPWAELKLQQLEQIAEEERLSWEALVSRIGAKRDITSDSVRHRRVDAVARLAAECLGETLDTSSHPNYTKNPFTKVPGDDAFTDPEHQQEYRRLYDSRQTVLRAIQTLRQQLTGQVERADATIYHAADRLPKGKAR